MSNDKSRAIDLAECLEGQHAPGLRADAAPELRRLDAVNRELLEALQKCVDHCLFPSASISDAEKQALAAIAKAADV